MLPQQTSNIIAQQNSVPQNVAKDAAEALRMLRLSAKHNLSDFAEFVFDFDNGKHHHEWYNILMNKLRSPRGANWDAELEPAPAGWINHLIGIMAPRNHANSTCFTVV